MVKQLHERTERFDCRGISRQCIMGAIVLFLAVFFLSLACLALRSSSSSSPSFRGISPQDEDYYKATSIRCRDGSKSFSSEHLNDDFCDCGDGTDEPGTSACVHGKFYCQNKGHTPLSIFSSRVNDGICDCCDGSDEYDGKAKCTNTCSELGKVWRDKLRKKISTFKIGLEVRNRDVARSKLMIQKDKLDLANLKVDEKKLKAVVKQLGAKKKEIEKAAERDKLEQEKEDNTRKEEENTEQEIIEPEGENQDQREDAELETEKDIKNPSEADALEQTTTEGLSKEELGRLVASRWTGENPNLMNGESQDQEDNHHLDKEELDEEDNDDDNMDDEPEEGDLNGEAIVQDDDENADIKHTYGHSEADRILEEYRQTKSKLSDIRLKISDLEKKLGHDFGKDEEFYSLYDKCFDLEENKYTYRVCPYKHGLQMEEHSSTTLGKWDGFKDEYRIMQFTRGAKCWNGPDRSLKVRLRCGSKVELRDMDEPSRCEYVAELVTPAVCYKERLVALQQRLNMQDGNPLHDEL